ncbi:MAG: ATP cone domain-containing protein [Candidatus Thorarchaeota archaeon]|nr:ATP cone domain-containing protein [Candidatus Thorarchaeota archaeon]
MKVEKRDRRIVDFDDSKIEAAITKAFEAGNIDTSPVRGITKEVVQIIHERGKEVINIEEIQDIVEDTLMLRGFTDIARRYMKYREKHQEARRILQLVGVVDDLKFGPNAATVLKRYLLKNEEGKAIETPSQLFRRVSGAVASIEKKYDESADVKEYDDLFYSMMANLEFLPNSPTLFNAGTALGQCSACFVLPIDDDMNSIFTSLKHMAMVQKSGGGTGFSFSRLRPKGARVGTTGGVASGPVSFMRAYDTATDVIKQGGRRRGANMAILRCDHPDIMEFISCKSDKQAFRNFNISVAITEKFMSALRNDAEIELISPHTKESVKSISARAIFDAIVHNAWNTGDPGLIFIDRINEKHPLSGELIESTNPCVSGDTIVSTSKGLMNIQDVPGVMKTAKKLVFRLQTKEGYQVKVTRDHRILTISGWKQAGDLCKGDKLCLQVNEEGFGQTGNLRIGQILGWYVGDGWSTGKDRRATLAFYGRDKGRLTHYFLSIVNEELESDLVVIKSKKREEVRSRRILKLVQDWEMESKNISKLLLSSSMECQRGFLQGLFSADGSVQGSHQKGFTVRLSQSNLDVLRRVQIMLLNFGIVAKIYSNRRSEQKRLMPNSKGQPNLYRTRASHELIISKENIVEFRDRIGFLLEYKQKRLVDGIESLKARGPYKERFFAKFESLTPLQEEDVFDIVATPRGGFVANGIIVHNCGEQPLLPYESCVLGSINLSKMVREGEVHWERLEEVIRLAVRFLDNIIDLNVYPVPEIETVTKANRKIGLGIMGFAELLIQLGIPYDSEGGLEKAEKIMSFIKQRAERASSELAKIRGNFENFALLKKRNTWKRNATLITVAPTGSIGLIAQTSSGIEPLFAVAHSRILAEGINLSEVNPLFKVIAEKRGIWTDEIERQLVRTGTVQDIDSVPEDIKRLFKTAHEIDPTWHVRMQASFQKHTDNAVSKTVNLPNQATTEDIERIFLLADELQLKGITVFRDGCLDGVQVLYSGCTNCEVQ